MLHRGVWGRSPGLRGTVTPQGSADAAPPGCVWELVTGSPWALVSGVPLDPELDPGPEGQHVTSQCTVGPFHQRCPHTRGSTWTATRVAAACTLECPLPEHGCSPGRPRSCGHQQAAHLPGDVSALACCPRELLGVLTVAPQGARVSKAALVPTGQMPGAPRTWTDYSWGPSFRHSLPLPLPHQKWLLQDTLPAETRPLLGWKCIEFGTEHVEAP